MKTNLTAVQFSNYPHVVALAQQSSSVAEEEDTQPSSPSSGTSSESRSEGPHRLTRSRATPVKKSGKNTSNDQHYSF